MKVPELTCYPDNNVKRLKAMAVRHQKKGNITAVVIEEGSNLHGHTWSCFDCEECVPKMVEIPKSKNAHVKTVMSVIIIIQLTRN